MRFIKTTLLATVVAAFAGGAAVALNISPNPELIDTAAFGGIGPSGITYHPQRGTIFIVVDLDSDDTSGNGVVFELDLEGDVLNSFPVANSPQGITFDPVTQDLLVADGEGEIRRYDETGASVAPVPFLDLSGTDSSDADGIAIHPVTKNVWIADDNDERIYEFDRMGNEISRFDTDTEIPELDEPEGLSFDGTDLIVADNGTGTRTVYRFSTDGTLLGPVVFTEPSGLNDPEGVAVLPNGGLAVVSDNDNLLGLYSAAAAAAPALSWPGVTLGLLLLSFVARRRL